MDNSDGNKRNSNYKYFLQLAASHVVLKQNQIFESNFFECKINVHLDHTPKEDNKWGIEINKEMIEEMPEIYMFKKFNKVYKELSYPTLATSQTGGLFNTFERKNKLHPTNSKYSTYMIIYGDREKTVNLATNFKTGSFGEALFQFPANESDDSDKQIDLANISVNLNNVYIVGIQEQ